MRLRNPRVGWFSDELLGVNKRVLRRPYFSCISPRAAQSVRYLVSVVNSNRDVRRRDRPIARNDLRHRRLKEASTGQLISIDHGLTLDPILLRDACRCSQCVDPSTGQREFLFADIPLDIKAIPRNRNQNGDWEIAWENDVSGFHDHVSTFSPGQVAGLTYRGTTTVKDVMIRIKQALWTRGEFQARGQKVAFPEFMEDERGLAQILLGLRRDGLVFITDVPSNQESVSQIAQRIGPLRTTFYGPTWDVRSVVDSKNVAYTSKYLGFHMDLLYMQEPPGLQFLHCIHNSCSGGESRFVDTFKAMDTLITEQPQYLQPLRRENVTYHYDNDGYYYAKSRRVFHDRGQLARDVIGAANPKEISNLWKVYWSPPFMANLPKRTPPGNLRRFLQATKTFADILERESLVYETKMEEGTCVIFDNLRVVHARNAFDTTSGQRWLKGAYMDTCDFYSRLITMEKSVAALLDDGTLKGGNS